MMHNENEPQFSTSKFLDDTKISRLPLHSLGKPLCIKSYQVVHKGRIFRGISGSRGIQRWLQWPLHDQHGWDCFKFFKLTTM